MTKMVSLDKVQPLILERLELANLRFVLETNQDTKIKIIPVMEDGSPYPSDESLQALSTFQAVARRGTVISATKNLMLELVSAKINEIDAKLKEFNIGNG